MKALELRIWFRFCQQYYFIMFFFSFLIISLYLLILAIIVQIFNPIAELVIPTGIPSNEAKAEIEIHPVPVEAKVRNCYI